MKKFLQKIKNMKYRHKLTILLVVASLIPMTGIILYSHGRMSTMIRRNETEDMQAILEQARENIDSQIQIFASLLNYLTYSPDIEEIIEEKNLDNYTAYEQYTEVADPLLSVPKSYHDAINQIRLFADSIQVEHEYTLVPLENLDREWWSAGLGDDVRIQWAVNEEEREIAAVRKLYDGKELEAVLCVTLDYDKIFQPLTNILGEDSGAMVTDGDGDVIYLAHEVENLNAGWDSAEEALAGIGKVCEYSVSTDRHTDWTFYFFKSKASISRAVFQLLREEIPLIIFSVVVLVFLGLFFSRLFTRKIEELTRNMDRVNHGSREVTVTSDSGDEVGILIRSFRRMMDEINRLIDEVYVNKLSLKEYELKALQAQINPHFLYNTLSAINWMALKGGQKEISRVTLALSAFYRTALSKGEDMVTVENCIRNMEAYLEIQLVMHDNDFTVEWDVDESIKNEKMPKLLLQPVVENALEHGLDEKEEGERKLKLSFLDMDQEMLIMVQDNGPGMDQEKADTLVTYQAQGYGLKNVNDRIRLLYGEDYAVRIFSRPGEGTKVEMRFPKERKKE
ncbi:MAG TPA: sensor histidine kinase [Candidatus Blautia excrementigallinarum]|nr:sensor histidine kinase [Candidatus Blautia excrementigallinarum]